MWLPMPTLSPSMESGTITQWTRKEGQDIEQYQVLLKLTTGATCMSHRSDS
jgi:pyruvate/2-oxoglutarate dehydrogenase complex dihydrolipoamide acyltransferase (E2) component